MNKKILIAVIAILAITIVGIIALNTLLTNDDTSPSKGTMAIQSDVPSTNVAILGPEETLKTGITGNNGEITFTDLPDGTYQVIANKEGYSNHYVLSTSINHGGRTTLPIYMNTVPEQDTLHLSTNPLALIIKQGNSKTVTATATSLNSFMGEVSMNCTVLPSGVTAAFNPESSSITADGKISSTLTLTVGSTVTKGIYQVYINMDYGSGEISGYGLLLQVT